MASTLALALALAGGALALGLPLARQWQDSTDRQLEQRPEAAIGRREEELAQSDPSLVAKYSTYESLQTQIATYPAVRVFNKPHAHADKLPNEPPLTLLVFLHGLGGSLSQFHLLLTSLVNAGPCLSIDLPGCGRSPLVPRRWDAYSFEALVQIWIKAIETHCDSEHGQKVVLIGHSLGCMLSQAIAHRSHLKQCRFEVAGLVAICPGAARLSSPEKAIFKTLLSVPGPVFDLWRAWDKRGGANSASVVRFVGKAADQQTRELQFAYNDQSQTPTFRRFAWGLVEGNTPDTKMWAELPTSLPILLIGAEDDPVTPPQQLANIRQALEDSGPRTHLKTSMLPGSHALPYDHNNYRSVAGLIEELLGEVDPRLSLGWQLNYLATEGKWEVKNVAKWQSIEPVSDAIGQPVPIFRAMKTMREVDDGHSPALFAAKWSSRILAVIDISHDTPVYDPRTLEDGGIAYHKFPTVSKYPPDEKEVRDFVLLVDKIRSDDSVKADTRQIAVHCHYGFNRTGFFIVAYLVEKCGYTVQRALDEFAEKRPPGIRHEHFLDALFLRYSSKHSK